MRSLHTLQGVLAIAVVAGIVGGWSLWAAADQYNTTIRTYSELGVAYQSDTFVWLDPAFESARATIVLRNHSPFPATVENLALNLDFDGEFAGSNYGRFEPIVLASGAVHTLELVFQITSPSIQARGGTARLTVHGYALIDFDGIERELTLRVVDDIGVVAWMES